MRKPRTNYEALIGQVINDVLVVDTKPVPKVSRTGREYKVRRLWVTKDNEHILEIGTQSWHKKSFMKRLDKITIEKPVEVKEEPKIKQMFELVLSTRKVEEPVEVVEPTDELHDLKTTYNLRQLKGAYRTLARKYHPDNLETGDSDRFKLVKTIFDVRKLIIEVNLETFGYDDPDFAELVDMAEDLHKTMHNIQY